MYKLAVDAMGGDYGPSVTVPACVDFLVSTPDASILLVGNRTMIQKEFDIYKQRRKIGSSLVDEVCNSKDGRLTIRHTELEIKMDQAPANALKHGKDSSLWICLDEVKNGDSDGAVSAGNTGALMALSRHIVKTISGISRPAIASSLPNVSGAGTTVLDLGANISCDADQLLQFAIMGTAFSSAVENITSPSVGLLNVGTETSKGDGVLRQAGKLLKESPINFIGNVEGNDIFYGKVDVVVCDGLTGNVALKSSEGLAQLIRHHLKAEFSRSLYGKIASIVSLPIFKRISNILDHRTYNGAALVGLDGVVFKSHGSADELAFTYAIKRAAHAIENDLNGKIRTAIIGEQSCRKKNLSLVS